MRIQIMSDLHLEFDGDNGKTFLADQDPYGVDVLVLAGDITIPRQMFLTLRNICEVYKNTEILYVLGNHDLVASNIHDVSFKTIRKLNKLYPNFTWLENTAKEITVINSKGQPETQRFIGCTLWYPDTADALMNKKYWFDFRYINNANGFIFNQNKKSLEFLNKELSENDIVITHMLPSFKSVAPKYVGEVTNCFFVCDVEKLIIDRNPSLWFHGHTHNSFDYKLGNTRVICNPRGYVKSPDLNKSFDRDLVVDTERL